MQKFKFSFSVLICFSLLFFLMHCQSQSVKVGYIINETDLSAENQAVYNWLETHSLFKVVNVSIQSLPDVAGNFDVIWWHVPDSNSWQSYLNKGIDFSVFKKIYNSGAKLLLTNYASLLPYAAGIESVKPEVHLARIEDNWLFDKKGLQSWKGHTVFYDLFGGAFVWDAYEDHTLPLIGYYDDVFPLEGRVVAVEKSYIRIHPKRKLMIEYDNGAGQILTIGGMVYLGQKNRVDFKLHKLLENSLQYLAGKKSYPNTYWRSFEYRPRSFTVKTAGVKAPSVQDRKLKNIPNTGIVMNKTPGNDQFFDLAGRRALVMGKEKGGINEVWMHPLRIIRDFESGVVSDNRVIWLSSLEPSIEVRPESFSRTYQTPAGKLQEIIFTDINEPVAFAHYRAVDESEMQIVIRFRSDLRWMWPYDENALGDMWYGFDEGLNALHMRDSTSSFYALMGGDIAPLRNIDGAYEEISYNALYNTFDVKPSGLNQVYHGAVYKLSRQNDFCMNYLMLGTDQGKAAALKSYRKLLMNPRKSYLETTKHYQDLLKRTLSIHSPDEQFNDLWRWGIVGTDRFWAHTPSLGTGLLAGFSTTAKGWDGGHKNSGRPGYAWYFGRDAAWSCFAVDDYGDFKMVRKQLEFFQRYQEVSGKIFHELSTSGVVHYDAADATPLYIILAAHYLRASGDLEFIRSSWPHIQKAMHFMYSTDTNGDGLIENTNVGHGWVEGGKLWGVNTTFYLAGLWAQVLEDAAYMANLIGHSALAEQYLTDKQKVVSRINREFWNDEEKFFYYGKFDDDSFNPEKTVLPAVVMYFNEVDDEKSQPVLNTYAGNGFSSNWGVRILGMDSPLFNPTGYHYGSIWPLFTGWTALAEYEYGHSVQGFTHIINNMYIKNFWALGYVEEVLHGAEYKPSGVCPHQCWSETNVLHPAITGMIGWKPNAPKHEAYLKPRFPLHWDSVTVKQLRAGETVLQLTMKRTQNKTIYSLNRIEGPPVVVHLQPEIPQGMQLKTLRINGVERQIVTDLYRGLIAQPIVVNVDQDHEVTFTHSGGIGMIPLMPKPFPGDDAIGARIISEKLTDNKFIVGLEGIPNKVHRFSANVFDQKISNIDNGRLVGLDSNGILTFDVIFPQTNKPFAHKQVVIYLSEK